MTSSAYVCKTCDKPFTFKHSYGDWVPPQCPGCNFGSEKRSSRSGTTTVGNRGDGIYTDGACIGNPGPGGWAFVRVRGGEPVRGQKGRDAATTNNRMELTAVVAALSTVKSDENVTIFTDSKLVVDTLNEWAEGWKARGWTKKGGPIKNLDLVKTAYALKQSLPGVQIVWVKGHNGDKWNEYVDDLANAAATEAAATG